MPGEEEADTAMDVDGEDAGAGLPSDLLELAAQVAKVPGVPRCVEPLL